MDIEQAMNIAQDLASVSEQEFGNGLGSGCVIVADQNILARNTYIGQQMLTPSRDGILSTWIEHAERVAIYDASMKGIRLYGSVLYLYPYPPCAECARAIVLSGIKTVCLPLPLIQHPDLLVRKIDIGIEILKEWNINIVYSKIQTRRK